MLSAYQKNQLPAFLDSHLRSVMILRRWSVGGCRAGDVGVSAGHAARATDFPNGVRDALGPQFGPAQGRPSSLAARTRRHRGLRHWNQIAIDASGLDHTPVAPNENRVFGEQLGPGRSSRAMAIVHIAIFDAVNAIVGGYRSYTVSLARATMHRSKRRSLPRRTIRWSRCFRHKRKASTTCLSRI
jgi:hypothetical protein